MPSNNEVEVKISADIRDAVDKMKDFVGSLEGVKSASESMSGSVLEGVASWDILKEGMSKAKDFMIDTIKGAIDHETAMNSVKASVEATGKSYTEILPKLEGFSQSIAPLGVSSEIASLGVIKLGKAAKGDFDVGMKAAELASDLAAGGVGDFQNNVDGLQRILMGVGSRALIQFGINSKELDDKLGHAATTSEQMNAVTEKLTTTTEIFGESTSGKIGEATVSWQEIKDEIGGGFLVAIQQAFAGQEYMNGAIAQGNEYAQIGKQIMYSLGMALKFLFDVFATVGAGIAAFIGKIQALYDALSGKKSFDQMASYMNELDSNAVKSANNIINSFKGIFTSVNDAEVKQKEFGKTIKDTKDAVDGAASGMQNSFANIKNTNQDVFNDAKQGAEKAQKAYKDLESALKDLDKKYKDLETSTTDTLLKMKEENASAMASIQKDIAATQQKIKDLNTEFSKGKKEDSKSAAEEVVKTEKDIAALKIELAKTTDAEEYQVKSKQLAALESALSANADFIKSINSEVIEARRRDSLTDLGRTIEDFNAKRVLAQQEYDAKVLDLNNELIALQKKDEEEKTMYMAKTEFINTMLKNAELMRRIEIQNTKKLTIDSVKAEIEIYEQLQAAINRSNAAKSASILLNVVNPTTGSIYIPKRAEGGIVTSPEVALIGEAGPEAIIPLNKLAGAGMGSITVNINGGTYLSENVAEKIGDLIINKLQSQLRV